jgi:hypothetical protein
MATLNATHGQVSTIGSHRTMWLGAAALATAHALFLVIE